MLSSLLPRPTQKHAESARPTVAPHARQAVPAPDRNSMRPVKAYQPRLSRLDDPRWHPFENSAELAQQIYELTHPC